MFKPYIEDKDIEFSENTEIAEKLRELAEDSPEPQEHLTFTRYAARRLSKGNDSFNDVINTLYAVDSERSDIIGFLNEMRQKLTSEQLVQIDQVKAFLKKHGVDIPDEQTYLSRHSDVTDGPVVAKLYRDTSTHTKPRRVARSTIFMQPKELGKPLVVTKITNLPPYFGYPRKKYELWQSLADKSLYLPINAIMSLAITFPRYAI